jgi:uncharacterized membrane protein YgcG
MIWRLLLSLALLVATSSVQAEERILSWNSAIRVRPDSTLEVAETLKVRAEGDRIRRGILRDFPTTYENRRGERVVTGFRVLSVMRDGRPEPYRTERLMNGVRVRIGDADVFLPPADYTYTIVYRTDRQIGFFNDHDELYWNVTGNGWDFPIDEAEAQVFLPGEVAAQSITAEAYTGPQGARGKDLTASVGPSNATFRTKRGLGPREGLTIVVSWPKGVVTAPSAWQQGAYQLRDTWPAFLSVGGLLLLIGYYLRAWLVVGRDPPGRIVVPQYEPPAGLSPAAMRFTERMAYDDKCFGAAVLNLAVKGGLRIEEQKSGLLRLKSTFTLHRTEAASGLPLSDDETELRDKLFGSESSIALENSNHARISGAKSVHKSLLEKRLTPQLFRVNRGWLAGGIALSLLVAVVAVLWPAGFHGFGPGWWFATEAGWISIGSALLAVAANAVFAKLLKAPTVAGRAVMDQIEGFKLYLDVAEGDELGMIDAPPLTTELYERYLPAALALGVEQSWAEHFAAVFATQAEGRAPRWYSGDRWDTSHVGRFSASLGSSLNSAVSSASKAPGSSSGRGGGSSGGGGGGGGGGGW